LKGQTDKIDYLLEVSEYCKNAKERMEREEIELRQRRMQRRLEEKEEEEKKLEIDKKEMKKKISHLENQYIKLYEIDLGSKRITEKNYQYYLDNYETFKLINKIIEMKNKDDLDESPRKIFKMVYKYDGCQINEWKNLVKLVKKRDIIDKLLIALKIRIGTRKMNKYSWDKNSRSFSFYLNAEEKKAWKEEYENYNEFEKLELVPESKLKTLQEYVSKFRRYHNKMENGHYQSLRETDEWIRQKRAEKGLDPDYKRLAKVYPNLCSDCKDNCIGCGKSLGFGGGRLKSLGEHIKCVSDKYRCYLCDKSLSYNVRCSENRLCNACYDSNKYFDSKCIICGEKFVG
jgi:hypothetical protein